MIGKPIPSGQNGRLTYDTSGLTFTNCSYVAGGYAKINNLVVVCIRVKCTNATPQTLNIAGFPEYEASISPSKNLVVCSSYNMTSESSFMTYSELNRAGGLLIKGTLENDKEYGINAVYLCE